MKELDIGKSVDNKTIIHTLRSFVYEFIKNSQTQLMNNERKECFFQRVNVFVKLSITLIESRSSHMKLCILHDGEVFQHASYIEVQLTDTKNTIVYAAATMER